MKKLRSILLWIVCNGLFVTALIYGYVYEIHGAKNIALFMAWFTIVLSPFVLIEDVYKTLPNIVPRWLNISYDVCVIAFMIWHGAIATAIFYIVHTFMVVVAYEKRKLFLEKEKELTDKIDKHIHRKMDGFKNEQV